MSRALARDRLGMPAVLAFILAGVAPLTVAAGVIPSAYATTGLTGIPAAFLVVAVILALFATGYMAMARRITNAGAFYAFIARGLGRIPGTAAALVALAAYSLLQVALYGAFGPAAASQAAVRSPGPCPVRWSVPGPCPVPGAGAGRVSRCRSTGSCISRGERRTDRIARAPRRSAGQRVPVSAGTRTSRPAGMRAGTPAGPGFPGRHA
jgi:hypothetical protein